MNSIFDLLASPAFSDLFKNTNVKEETLDLTSKEGHDLAVNTLDSALSNNFVKSFFSEELLNNIRKSVDTIYENAQNKEAEVVQPSTQCTDAQKEQIMKLVNEYVDTVIQPKGNFKPEVVKSVKNSLFEFACWIMTK